MFLTYVSYLVFKHLIMSFFCILCLISLVIKYAFFFIKVLTLKVDIRVEKCTGKFDNSESYFV